MRQLRTASALALVETRLFLREPFAVFFSLAFPLILLVFVGSIGGEGDIGEGVRFIDAYLATMVGLTAANVGVMGLAVHIAESRKQGVLKRYRLSPMPGWAYFAAQFATAVVVVALSLLVLAAVTFALYGPAPQTRWAPFVAVCVLALYVTLSLGILLGGLPLPVRSVQVVSAGVFFLMFFSSGAALPRESFPDWLQAVTAYNPLTVLNAELVHAYTAQPVRWVPLLLLALVALLLNLITVRAFDWEGTR